MLTALKIPVRSPSRAELLEELAYLTGRPITDFRDLTTDAAATLVRKFHNGELNPKAVQPMTAAAWLRERGIGAMALAALRQLGWVDGEPPLPPAKRDGALSKAQVAAARVDQTPERGRSSREGRLTVASRKVRGAKKRGCAQHL